MNGLKYFRKNIDSFPALPYIFRNHAIKSLSDYLLLLIFRAVN